MLLVSLSRFSLAIAVVVLCGLLAESADWPRFRGPNGSGVSTDEKAPPTQWSETKNLKWKFALPGPGLSSPIVVGDRVYVTCWSGYGASRGSLGDQKDLKRHLVCVHRADGKVQWSKEVGAVLPEEDFRGMFAENGYASHTPVCDGERVFAFFGKSGVIAFDLEGKELWRKSVGTQDDPRSWGTASSPILYKNLVIVPAAIESQALIAFHKKDGSEAWRQPAKGFAGCWSTPILVDLPGGEQELVMGVPYEIWGFNPQTGKLKWFCEFTDADSMCSSVVAQDGVVYAVEGRSGGSIAVKAGGKDDVSKTHVVWSGSDRGRIGTPVVHEGLLYHVTGGVANCLDAKTGKKLYQSRLGGGGGAVADADPPAGRPGGGRPMGGFGGGGFGGGGGRGGGQDYSSPVIAGGKLYYVTRGGEMHVVATGKEFKLVATNRFDSDKSNYSATPAISNGELFIRSNTHLYCIAEK